MEEHGQFIDESVGVTISQQRSPCGISAQDWNQLKEWNSQTPKSTDACIHEVIRKRAFSQPDSIAVCAWDGSFTYHELEDITSRLASFLREKGIEPNTSVPFCIEKSKWAIVAMFAIMKVGAAFVPLDPGQPLNRLSTLIQELDAQFVLSSVSTANIFARNTKPVVVVVDQSLLDRVCLSAVDFVQPVNPDQVAFIMFTSGSTGRPSGVQIEHRAMLTAVTSYATEFGFSERTRFMQACAFIWLPSTLEIIATLIWGGRVCVPSEEDRLNNASQFMREHEVDMAVATPSFLTSLDPNDIPSLRVLGAGGEKLPQDLIDKWAARVNLILSYGSTETNLCVLQSIPPGPLKTRARAAGCAAWLVDLENRERLVAIGEVGELVIEGFAHARGYLHDEQKTSTKFYTAPRWLCDLRDGSPTRLCATGDLARYNSDGTLELLGRKDTATKLRGQKIELGEVEACIEQVLPSKMRAVAEVTALAGDSATQRLVAFVSTGCADLVLTEDVLDTSRLTSSTRELMKCVEQHLLQHLPTYLVPSGIVPIPNLPLTSSGKIDRQQLRLIASSLTLHDLAGFVGSQNPFRPPCTPIELRLRDLWVSLLKIEKDIIGLEDNFFRLGGDSLVAIHLVSAARKIGMLLTVDQIFKNPTLHDLAKVVQCIDQELDLSVGPFELIDSPYEVSALQYEISQQYGIDMDLIEDMYPATNLQAGMIALSLKQPRAYTIQTTIPLPYTVDLNRFQDAWADISIQNPILRTRVVETSAGSMQVVLREKIHWKSEKELNQYLANDEKTAMTLGGLLTRYAIVETDPDERHFVWTTHHALLDAWSMSRTLSLVSSAYFGTQEKLAVGFNIFIGALKDIDEESQATYWREYLANADVVQFPALPDPAYEPRPSTSLQRWLALPTDQGSCTSATKARAAWALLMAQYVNSNDVVFGVTMSGRSLPVPHIDHIIGPTIATVPVRIQLNPRATIQDLLQSVQEESAEMIPFEQAGLHNIKRLSPDAHHACKFQTLLITQAAKQSELHFLSHNAEINNWQHSSTYALNLELNFEAGGMLCNAVFDENVISETQMKLMLTQFELIVGKVWSEDANSTVNDLEYISTAEIEQIFSWNNFFTEPVHRSSHEIIQDHSRQHSDTLAVISWDGDFTYKELDDLSTTLALHLVAKESVQPGEIIPIYSEKSKWPLISMLAVWKSGAAWTLLDSAHPSVWVNKIVKDTAARIVLCSRKCSSKLPPGISHLIVNAESMKIIEREDNNDHALPNVDSGSAAFVLYTSGSTGSPKGIVHEHGGYLAGVMARRDVLQRGPSSKVLQFSSYAFDAAIEDTITTFLEGGTVCIPADDERNNDLVNYVRNMGITHMDLTPSFAMTLSPDTLRGLKVLTLGGEAVTVAHRDLWAGKVSLVNAYGPSEIAITSHTKIISPDSEPSNLGSGTGCRSWITVVEDHNKLQAIGCIGELVLEGPILSRGYLNNPSKTAECFIENPSWLPSHIYGPRRLYKTGDLAVYSGNGDIRILGRKDNQVKLRGQRVELAQVEHLVKLKFATALNIVADIVSLRVGEQASTIVVFLECGEAAESMLQEVRAIALQLYSELHDALPAYMVPTALIPLVSLPLSVSGKTDRKKLRLMTETLDKSEIVFLSADSYDILSNGEPPSTPMENQIAALYAGTLNLPLGDMMRRSNFFHLGGDSILAMKMVATAGRSEPKLSLTVETIFRHPVLSDLAASTTSSSIVSHPHIIPPFHLLEDDPDSEGGTLENIAMLCNLAPEDIQDVYPCSPLQGGLMALSIKSPGSYISQQVFQLPRDIDQDAFKAAWEQVFNATAILRTRIVQTAISMNQVVVGQNISWSEHNNLEQYLEEDRKRPMTSGDALVRYALIDQSHTHFVWTIHHALYDGWSLSLILEHVERAYKGEPTRWPRVEYNHFIRHLRNLDLEAHANYWATQLENASLSTTVFPRIPSSEYLPRAVASIDYAIELPSSVSRPGTTSTLVQAAWTLLVSYYSESTDVLFGTTRTGRSAPLVGIDELVGPTFTTIPVRVIINPKGTVDALLAQLHTQTTEMIPFEHLGLTSIKQVSQDAAVACQFQTLVVIQPEEQATLSSDLFLLHDVAGDISRFNPYAIMLQVVIKRPNTLNVNVSFDSDLVEVARMNRILQQFEKVLQQICLPSNQAMALDEVEIVTKQDLTTIMGWNNNGVAPEPIPRCVHELIAERTQLCPDAEAVCAWDGTLSYSSLDRLSNSLAQKLIILGVGPDIIVPLCFEKSMWTIIGLMAVLKAGGAFLMLDPSQPVDRLKTIVRAANAQILLSSERCSELLKGVVQEICVVSQSTIAKLGNEDYEGIFRVYPNNLACVVFTSGSSGVPKGILLEHAAISTSILGHGPGLNMAGKRVYQFASYAFDMAVYDIVTTLALGGTVCTPSEDEKMNDLTHSINRLRADWAFFTPSTLKLLDRKQVPFLTTIVVGGEFVSQEIVDQWAEKVNLFQCSGPAETTTCIMGRMNLTTNKNRLGKGVNALCWIVDRQNHDVLTPIGTVGELVIEGPTLARGYIEDGRNLNEAFITAPKWAKSFGNSSRRFYKCGDLVQYNSDGTLNFIGRKDNQIKLRGQRIELNEVEDCVRAIIPDFHIAAEVVTPIDGTREPMIAAFLAPQTNHEISKVWDNGDPITEMPTSISSRISDINRHISTSIPSYMIPSAFINLSSMPLNGSGKVDRPKLRAFGSSLSVYQLAQLSPSNEPHVSPSTRAESLLCELWGLVLSLNGKTISANDSFLRLGGDSLAAMRLVALARQRELTLTVAIVFKFPRLCDMASHMAGLHKNLPTLRKPYALIAQPECVLLELAADWNIEPDQIEDAYPCTPLQEGLMSLSSETSGAYTAQEVYELPLEVDISKFKVSCEAFYQASTILRTCIVQTRSGELLQIVSKRRLHWNTAIEVDEYLDRDQSNPIGIGNNLTRWCIVESASGRFFIWTRHHATYDGFSLPLSLSVLEDFYRRSDIEGQALPNTIQGDFGVFVDYLQKTDAQSSRDYWNSILHDAKYTKFLAAPGSHKIPDRVDSVTREVMVKIASNSNITLSTHIRAAWAILIAKHTNSNDVILGEIISGRNVPLPGVEGLLGPTFATVPIRIQLEDQVARISSYLEQVQNQMVDMIPHQHFGLQRIMQIGPEIREACQFETLLVIQPESNLQRESLMIPRRVHGHSLFYTHALTLICRLGSDGICITAHFDPTAIDSLQVERLLAQFEHVLLQLLFEDTNEKRLVDINYVSPQDHAEIKSWNQHSMEKIDLCVHDVFRRITSLQPDAPAIDSWDGMFTYAELDAASDRLAWQLVRMGVGPEVLVPLCFPKSALFIVSIFAVLKAGGAYIGIDPNHPSNRIDSIIQSAGAKFAVSSPELSSVFARSSVEVVAVSKELLAELEHPSDNYFPRDQFSPSNLASVVFTSGSTGIPKGIQLEHASICTSTRIQAPELGIEPGTRVFQFASHAWDAVLAEVVMPLMYGACVCVPEDQERMNDLVGAFNRMKANWLLLTPTVASLFNPSQVPGMKRLVLAGEAATERVLETWRNFPGYLHNIYGPAECTIFCIWNKQHAQAPKPSYLGRRITGKLWVVDPEDHDQLMPIGATGELLIEGPLLARGYLNDNAKTDLAFIYDPTWALAQNHGTGRRMYKSGDLVRYNADGSFEILGRKDTQVKLNGQRMDPAEIELNIRTIVPDARHVVVDIVSSPSCLAKPVLAAFIAYSEDCVSEDKCADICRSMSEEQQTSFVRLKSSLASLLPSFMVPSLFVPLERIPINSSGKLSRRALQSLILDFSRAQLESYMLADASKRLPSTPMEMKLRDLWSSVLGVKPGFIGIEDSFFNLGGDSILAMRLASLARSKMVSLPVSVIFRHAHLTDMADHAVFKTTAENDQSPESFSLLENDSVNAFVKDMVATQLRWSWDDIADVYPATDYQAQALASVLMKSRGMMGYFTFQGNGGLDIERMKSACNQLIKAHAILRTVFVHDKDHIFQVVLKELQASFHVYEVLGDLEAVSKKVCARDVAKELSFGDVFVRFLLFKDRSSTKHRLIMRMSHAQYDGVCLPKYLETLQRAYNGLEPMANPSFSAYIRESLLQRQPIAYEYWTNLLHGSTMTEVIPRQRPNYRSTVETPSVIEAKVPLLSLSREGITAATIIKAAWALTIADFNNQEDVVFTSTVAGRNVSLPEAEKIVGACLSVVPVRVSIQAGWSGIDLLSYVHEQHIRSIQHELLGMLEIVRHCSDWPNWVRPGSIVQHDEHINENQDLKLGDVNYTMGSFGPPAAEFADIAVHSHKDGDCIAIRLMPLTDAISTSFVEDMLSRLCYYVSSLSQDPYALLYSIRSAGQTQHLPIVLPMSESDDSGVSVSSASSASSTQETPKQDSIIVDCVRRAWHIVLGPKCESVNLSGHDSFFDVGGDIVGVSQLAALLQRQGFSICMEDLIDFPRLRQQVQLLSADG